MYAFVYRKGLRGGISVICNRYIKANNKYIGDDYNPNEKSKFIMYLDANSLYDWSMTQYLPTGKFKFIYTENFDVSKVKDDDKYGYILEVDFEYPHELHNSHSDYPLAPERLIINNNMLSNYSKDLKKKLFIGNSKIEKLVPNLFNKTKYVTHYRNLKFYLEQGLKLIKIHKILQFEQSSWLKSYIEFNTEKRKIQNQSSKRIF